MTSKKPKTLEVPIGLKSTPYFWWFLMNIPPYPSFSRENQTYPSAQGHCGPFMQCNIGFTNKYLGDVCAKRQVLSL